LRTGIARYLSFFGLWSAHSRSLINSAEVPT